MWESAGIWKMTVTNHYTHEEIKSILNLTNAYYHSGENLLSSNLLSKHTNIKICRTMNLSVLLCRCKLRLSHVGEG